MYIYCPNLSKGQDLFIFSTTLRLLDPPSLLFSGHREHFPQWHKGQDMNLRNVLKFWSSGYATHLHFIGNQACSDFMYSFHLLQGHLWSIYKPLIMEAVRLLRYLYGRVTIHYPSPRHVPFLRLQISVWVEFLHIKICPGFQSAILKQ